jgi:predicted metal-dependent hydrolase
MAIDYMLKVTKRARRITLRLVDGQLVIVSPRKLAPTRVDQILSHHQNWISTQLTRFESRSANRIKLQHGQRLNLLGNQLEIAFQEHSRPKIELTSIQINVLHPQEPADYLEKWLRKYAARVLPNRVKAFAAAFGYEVQAVSVRNQSTRWGSCSGHKRISINWRLVFAPINVLDYVVVHELAHLKHMNHSAQFWDEVARMMPDYAEHRKWLKLNGDSLALAKVG